MNALHHATIAILALAATGFAQAQTAEPAIPENATANSSGYGWTCDPDYIKRGDNCEMVVVPVNTRSFSASDSL